MRVRLCVWASLCVFWWRTLMAYEARQNAGRSRRVAMHCALQHHWILCSRRREQRFSNGSAQQRRIPFGEPSPWSSHTPDAADCLMVRALRTTQQRKNLEQNAAVSFKAPLLRYRLAFPSQTDSAAIDYNRAGRAQRRSWPTDRPGPALRRRDIRETTRVALLVWARARDAQVPAPIPEAPMHTPNPTKTLHVIISRLAQDVAHGLIQRRQTTCATARRGRVAVRSGDIRGQSKLVYKIE